MTKSRQKQKRNRLTHLNRGFNHLGQGLGEKLHLQGLLKHQYGGVHPDLVSEGKYYNREGAFP